MAGYSGTPLAGKLGLKSGHRVALINPPLSFQEQLGPVGKEIRVVGPRAERLDIVMVFAKTRADLARRFPRLAKRLAAAGMFWVAWPKKSSGVPTDLSFEAVQRIGLEAGLVDTKICAVDETWSALRFVIRVKDRPREG
jgi:hypothetical protein